MASILGDDNSPFIDRKWLAETGTRFCVEAAELFTQRDGNTRWYLTIWVVLEDVLEVRKLTFDRTDKRDRGYKKLNDTHAFPLHSCWVKRDMITIKGGRTQPAYDVQQDSDVTTCPCGDLTKSEPESA